MHAVTIIFTTDKAPDAPARSELNGFVAEALRNHLAEVFPPKKMKLIHDGNKPHIQAVQVYGIDGGIRVDG